MCLQISTFYSVACIYSILKSENLGKNGAIDKIANRTKINERPALKFLFFNFFGRLQCVGDSFAYVAHYLYLRYVRIRTQRTAVANRRATNLATHLPTNSTRRLD
jgi:hypothetical protein